MIIDPPKSSSASDGWLIAGPLCVALLALLLFMLVMNQRVSLGGTARRRRKTPAPTAPAALAIPVALEDRDTPVSAPAPTTSPSAMIRLFGGCSVEGPHGRAAFVSPEKRALLGLLGEHRNVPLTREMATEGIWQGRRPRETRFDTILREIRTKLCEALALPAGKGTTVILSETAYRINHELITCDVWQFRDLLADATLVEGEEKAAKLRAAIDLYTGPYLPGLEQDWAHTAAIAIARDAAKALAQLEQLETAPA